MLLDFIRNHRILAILTILLLVGLTSFGIYLTISRIGKEPVEIILTPEDMTLTIDGQNYRSGTAYIKPGTYGVKAEREGFETFEGTVTIGQPNTTSIDYVLTPVSEEAKKWKEDNIDLYLAQEGRSSVRSNEIGKQFAEQFPITTKLPFRNFIYSIGYRLQNVDNPSEGIIIEITAITGSREAALNKIRELGFDPTNYEINFNNYENPFKS